MPDTHKANPLPHRVQSRIMDADDLDVHLSEIRTRWSKLLEPEHEILRYYGPVYRYLLAVTREPAAAQELTNEFAVRFLAGKFKNADPQAGRLRDFIKTAVRHLAVDYWRTQRKAKRAVSPEERGLADHLPAGEENDHAFEAACQEDFLAQTWRVLEQEEKAGGKPYFTVLRVKVDHPHLRSEQLAAQIGTLLGKSLRADAVRQTLHRARSLFADLLLDTVSRAISSTDPIMLEEELLELKLLDYCKSALQRRKKK